MHSEEIQPDTESRLPRILDALGLTDAGELLLWVPKAYRDCRKPAESIRAAFGRGKGPIRIRVTQRHDYDRANVPMGRFPDQRPFRATMTVMDMVGFESSMTVFGNLQPWTDIQPSMKEVVVFGEVESWNGQLQIKGAELVHAHQVGKLCPLYRGKPRRVAADVLGAAIREVCDSRLESGVRVIEEKVGRTEAEILKAIKSRYQSIKDLLAAMHMPANNTDVFVALQEAKRISAFHLKNQARQVRNRPTHPLAAVKVCQEHLQALIAAVPHRLTGDQQEAIREIVADLASDKPMRRVLSGDVGTGKSLAFLIPAVAAQQAGYCVMVMTPNALLAEQLVGEIDKHFPQTPRVLVTGNGAKKLPATPGILIGTTAIANAAKKAKLVPDLLICDEQHRLSRAQRECLLGPHTNLLEATATAIPRTVALATHGGMDTSSLRESPVKKRIITKLVFRSDRNALFKYMNEIVERGGQIAVVYPRLDDDGVSKGSVVKGAGDWEKMRPGQVGMLHGKLKTAEKSRVLQEFRDGLTRVLVCSTVIEVGVHMPGLRGMLVPEPQHYGVAQLHQLRGRLARTGGLGYMFLYSNGTPEDLDPETLDRLRLVEKVEDGFELAEQDANARGFGDLSSDSENQDGWMPVLFHGVKLGPADLTDED